MESALDMTGTGLGLPKWRPGHARFRAHLFLSQEAIAGSEAPNGSPAGFELHASLLDPGLPLPAELMRGAHVVIVEVRCEQSGALDRVQKLVAECGDMPVLVAVHEPSIADFRALMRVGVADILPLPLRAAELESALERIAAELERRREASGPKGQVVSILKSRGGLGATAILTQLGCLMAGGSERAACLLDLDVQAGSAALYLGQLPTMGLGDLIQAGERMDTEMFRTTLARHQSGLAFLAAPQEMMPLDAVDTDQVGRLVEIAAREFGTVLIDLPQDMTNWSLSVLAHSDLILLVCELSIASLHQARRQLDFLRSQDLGDVAIKVVVNKAVKGMFKSVDLQDAEKVLRQSVAFSVAADAETVRSALDQGKAVADISPRSRAARDLAAIAKALAPQAAEAR